MSSYADIGNLEIVENIAGIKGALSRTFCAAVSVQDNLRETIRLAVAQMSADDLNKLRGVTIEGSAGTGVRIRSFGNSIRLLDSPTVPKDFGLPEALVPIVMQDHLDYIEATDNDYAISNFRVGDDLTTAWHSDKGRTAAQPQAHRSFSEQGMYIASADPVIRLKKQNEHFAGEFFSATEVEKYAEAGDLVIRRQEWGERLYFREGFLHRSATKWHEKISEIPHLRMLTRGPRD